jgi:Ala-tRNA(Pro) deacylase
MSGVNPRLQALLDESGVSYEIIHHREDFRARTTAEDTHTPPSEFVKTVFVWIDGGYAMVALPATHFLAEGRMARSLGAEEIRLASESEIANLCPDCEVGAAPPFGKLFELATYASPGLAEDEHITPTATRCVSDGPITSAWSSRSWCIWLDMRSNGRSGARARWRAARVPPAGAPGPPHRAACRKRRNRIVRKAK